MTQNEDTRSVVIEKELPHPVEKVWRALTEGALLEEWLMKNNFEPVPGRRFEFTADWGSVEGEVLTVEPRRALAYTWEAFGLKSVVSFTLTASSAGTHLRVEQAGFRADQNQAYQGARYGWQKFLSALERVVSNLS
ncbi:MAG TPA: SRPBCC domain-containing protein [Steroidobacteraceae bacterium]|nr:SRPBCC domain-containing protein [Steroidobacteraceae bacterium]